MRHAHRSYRLMLLAPLVLLALATVAPAAKRGGSRDAWQQPARVVTDLNLPEGAAVGDVGCGSGYFVLRLAKAVGPKGKVYAEEIAEKALRGLRGQVAREKTDNVTFVIGEDESTHLPEAALDAAIVVNVLHHVPAQHRKGLIKDVARALKPGGYLYIIDWRVDATIQHDIGRRIPRADLLSYPAEAGLALDAEFLYLEHQLFLRFRKPAAAK